MNKRTKLKACTLIICFLAACAHAADAHAGSSQKEKTQAHAAANATTSTPTEVVRAFYTALRETRFRDALMMSVYRPAIEGLNAQDLDELKVDFARVATQVPPDFEFTGEQISGDDATVFMKSGEGKDVKIEPVYLIRPSSGGAWIVGDRDSAAAVKKQGKKFFFEQRIIAHEQDAEDMLKRIQAAQIGYALRNAGSFGDLNALVNAGFVPQDILGTETTGYHFSVTTSPDAKSFVARAEPEKYGRSGRLSFYMDKSGIQKKDTGGKPLAPPK
ncbi:MAG: hypothetical protein QOH51_173 [Acidobacteriota bacterium]|jgi:hypothetical protein|nr:hypothetical protein [Acidobacteriota bacterium]